MTEEEILVRASEIKARKDKEYWEECNRRAREYNQKCEDKLKARLLELSPDLPVNDPDFLGEVICAVQDYLDDIA